MTGRPPLFVQTLHPRLLVDHFDKCFVFYDNVLPVLARAHLSEGGAAGPYARWNRDGNPVLALLDNVEMAAMVGGETTAPSADRAALVFRLADVDAAQALCEAHGGHVISPAADRPEWGPEIRIAYLRDPAGTLIELQASPD
ncbi:VOC family protein [Actinoplanes sp. NPDC051343]|jgi:predicted enzyme related to lactoylglutathione lyase|uniref:VOC family protein n=1 Tax=Actinoplanes sp. NPDC051343 TaxID=3363906 RepID=UPI0037A20926